MNRLYAYMDEMRPRVEQALEKALPRASLSPEALHEAMRYSTLGGGKRMRAIICLMGARAGGLEDPEPVMPAACAVECIHAYSLIHDDLPCMDNAEMRRGKLACHRAFGEAMAVLAGDALLTLGFELLAKLPPEVAGPGCALLARGSGSQGMVGGQVLDLEGEGKELSVERIEQIDRWKTGALISASCRLGALVARAPAEVHQALTDYCRALGLLYQITDDLLDLECSTEDLGKSAGRDQAMQKATYPALLGVDGARERAGQAANEARDALKPLGKEALFLRLLVDHVLERKK